MTTAIQIEGLTKDFAVSLKGVRLRAVDQLDLEVENNQVYGLLGPNGSGKTTTLKMLLGLVKPSGGNCRIFGKRSDGIEARRQLGYLPESPYFYRFLTGRELVRFFGKLSGMNGSNLADRVSDVIERVGLSDAADRRIDTYSKGMLQRIGLAQALVHDPQLVILDEPTSGVDPLGAEAIATIIRQLKEEGRTVLLCSHQLSEVEALCDSVAILIRGKCLLSGELSALCEQPDRHNLEVSGLDGDDLAALETWVKSRGGKLESHGPGQVSLETLYLRTAREANGG